MFKILFIGDVVGNESVIFLSEMMPIIKNQEKIDMVIVNAENSDVSGYGISPKVCDKFFECGVDVITSGNHAWDNTDIINYTKLHSNIIFPLNIKNPPMKQGFCIVQIKSFKILVLNLLGARYMEQEVTKIYDCALSVINEYSLETEHVDGIVIDIHGLCPVEKKALAFTLDGKVSCVLGTHTHVPTADCMILPKGTGFQSDVGMVGSYYSLGGFDSEEAFHFLDGKRRKSWKPLINNMALFGTIVNISTDTGLCNEISTIRATKNSNMEVRKSQL